MACLRGAPVASLTPSPTFHESPPQLGTSSLTLDLRELLPPPPQLSPGLDGRGLHPHKGGSTLGGTDLQVGCRQGRR